VEPLDVLALEIAAVGVVLWFGLAGSGKLMWFVGDHLHRRSRDGG